MAEQPTNPNEAAPAPAAQDIANSPAPSPAGEGAEPAKKLSKEEQMAAFEEDLKYNDWGHQPC